MEMDEARRTMMLTYRYRLRDCHSAELNRQARAVNFVWNYCNEGQQRAVRNHRKWLTWIELKRLTAGTSKDLGLHSHTIQQVCIQYDRSRKQHRKPWLRWRSRKSLGWVPFGQGAVKHDGTAFIFRGVSYRPMHLRSIPADAVIRAGSFNQDARGRWYINIPIEVPIREKAPESVVGIDLGLKELATLSTGEKISTPKHYRRLEEKLGKAQRANKRRLARSIAAKIANARRDYLHKASARIALAHNVICVGNISSSKLARTRLAKSVLDAGWSTLRKQLEYKAIRHGSRYVEVEEAYTSQTCSACGALPEERPRGIAGLEVRRWECGGCGASHDRDVNAALNIARIGLDTLGEGALP